jgi:hypothetical protein
MPCCTLIWFSAVLPADQRTKGRPVVSRMFQWQPARGRTYAVPSGSASRPFSFASDDADASHASLRQFRRDAIRAYLVVRPAQNLYLS